MAADYTTRFYRQYTESHLFYRRQTISRAIECSPVVAFFYTTSHWRNFLQKPLGNLLEAAASCSCTCGLLFRANHTRSKYRQRTSPFLHYMVFASIRREQHRGTMVACWCLRENISNCKFLNSTYYSLAHGVSS